MSIIDFLERILFLIVLMNPLGAIPFFISMTEHQSIVEQRKAAFSVAFTVCMVIIASSLVGKHLIQFLGISVEALRISGGFILLLTALNMVNSQVSDTESISEEGRISKAKSMAIAMIVPLAIPILAGPVTISTVIIYASQAQDWYDRLSLIISGALLGMVIWIVLRLAEPFRRLLGKLGINIVTRLCGLLLAAMAIQFMVNGLLGIFPNVLHS